MGRISLSGDSPWKLNKLTDLMVLICYILKTVGVPVSKQTIIKVIEQEEIADYFDIIEAIGKLVNSGCIFIDTDSKDENLVITELGNESAEALENTLSMLVRKRAATAAIRTLYRQKIEHDNRASVKKHEDGSYYVTCEVLDGDKVLLSQEVRCSDIYQAERIKDQFMENPELIYRSTLAVLIGDSRFEVLSEE